MKDCPFGLTDIFISLTFKPSQYEFVSLIIMIPTFPGKGTGRSNLLEVDGSKLLSEMPVTKEDGVTWKGSMGEPSSKGNELIA